MLANISITLLFKSMNLPIDTTQFPKSLHSFFSPEVFAHFGNQQRHVELAKSLQQLEPQDLFDHPIQNQLMAKCCLSGLWLLINDLERSHEISQTIKTAEGSYWHGIMHRMEGDFWNAKYWFAQIGNHPTNQQLSEYVVENFSTVPHATVKSLGNEWNSALFVDFCDEFQSPTSEWGKLCKQLAVKQWAVLFAHCYGLA